MLNNIYMNIWGHFYGLMKKVRLNSPRKGDLVLFDNENSDMLSMILLDGFDYTILYTRQEIFNLSPSILFIMLKNILKPQFFSLMKTMKISGVLLLTYLYSCIEYINPKVVITFIDTDFHFQWISRVYKKAKFIAIQNGVRTNYDMRIKLPSSPHPASTISMPDLVCFGDYEKELYARHGHMIDRFHPVGSLFGGFCKNAFDQERVNNELDICLISEWEILSLTSEYYKEAKSGLVMLYDFFGRYLDEYCKKDHLNVCVATRTGGGEEADYFKEKYGDKVKLIMQDRKKFTTYRAMDRSDVEVGFVSTSLREAFGWGKKILACNFSRDENYDFPISGIWSLERGSYEAFKEKLNFLRSMSTDEFKAQTVKERKYLMNQVDGLPAHIYIRKMISENLKCQNRR